MSPTNKRPLYMAPGPANGLVKPGNTDLAQLPSIDNGDGTWSTVNSTSFTDEEPKSPTYGKEVLLRGILNGKITDDIDALRRQYYRDGKHLGVFADGRSADAYAQRLHEDWEAGRIPGVAMRRGDASAYGNQYPSLGALGGTPPPAGQAPPNPITRIPVYGGRSPKF